ncbi:MAG TPA: TraB/GumN family protein [Caulobacteraceae bacterium]|jgi:uncharacterized protein YbaP (TraB family)|nr:TraB/GumN family protein [Caulobacteraceae bacterium]
MRAFAAALFVLSFGAVAFAQDAPPPGQPASPTADVDLGSPVVEALEVVAQPPGPALWKVTKGASEVVVLGAVRPLPHSLVWDSTRLDRALDGASVLLVQPKFTIGLMDMIRFKVGGTDARQDKPLEETLPPALRAKFVGARTAARQQASRYGKLKPYVAAFMLVGDYREAAGLSAAKPDSTVLKLAKAHKVAVRPVAEYRVASAIKTASPMSEAASFACLQDAVDEVQWESDQSRAVAAAWAVGDLRAVRAAYPPSPLERCFQQMPNAAVVERGTDDSTRAIAAVLAKPGKAVAIVDLNFLLRPNGVLDRLKAQGATVTVPPG